MSIRIHPPKSTYARIRDSELPWDLGLGLLGGASFGVGAARFFHQKDNLGGWAAVVFAVAAIGLHSARAFRRHQKEDHHASNDWLLPVVWQIHDSILQVGQKFTDPSLRVCLHFAENEEWVQVTEYVGVQYQGGESEGLRNRRFPRRCGIIGLAARSPGSIVTGRVPGDNERESYLKETFAYETRDIVNLSKNAKSWAALLVGEPERTHVVIYCDSQEPDFFGPPASSDLTESNISSRKQVLFASGVSLARHIRGS